MRGDKAHIENYRARVESELPKYCVENCTLLERGALDLKSALNCRIKDEFGDLHICENCNWNKQVINMKKKIGEWKNIPIPIVCHDLEKPKIAYGHRGQITKGCEK